MKIFLFGRCELCFDDQTETVVPSRKIALLLAALAVTESKGFRREKLAEILWENREEAQARASLRQSLSALRKLVAASPHVQIDADMDQVRLTARDLRALDIKRFDTGCRSERLEDQLEAAEAYRGEFLEAYSLDASHLAFFQPFAAYYRRLALELCERLSADERLDDFAIVESLTRRLLVADPTAEEAHRALIRIFLVKGRRNAAMRQLDACRTALQGELGVDPEPRTLALLQDVDFGPGRSSGTIARDPRSLSLSLGPRRAAACLAIRPFADMTRSRDKFLVTGLVEDLAFRLARVEDVTVISERGNWNESTDYRIEGSVRGFENRCRVSVRLIATASCAQVWMQRYDEVVENELSFQDAIAERIVAHLLPAIREHRIDHAVGRRMARACAGVVG